MFFDCFRFIPLVVSAALTPLVFHRKATSTTPLLFFMSHLDRGESSIFSFLLTCGAWGYISKPYPGCFRSIILSRLYNGALLNFAEASHLHSLNPTPLQERCPILFARLLLFSNLPFRNQRSSY